MEIGGSDEDMRRAISIVDYLCLYQAVWSPPFLSLAVFGGFVVGNGHPAWSDARQGFFAQALPYYYRLTGNPEYLERAVSAARAALPLAFIPENAPISPIWNVGPPGHSDENYGHRGQDGRAVDHSIDFGVGYSLAAYGMIAHEYGDLYVDLEGRVAVGIDGIAVQRAEFEPAAVRLEVKAVSADRRPVQVVVEGCSPGDGHTVTVNGKSQSFTPDAERTSFRMTLGG